MVMTSELDRARHAEYMRAWRARNPDPEREIRRKGARRWAERHPETKRDRLRQWRASLRTKVLAHYGEVCACCGSTQMLGIDHIGGGGNTHRKALFGAVDQGGSRFYSWLIHQGFPDGYQTLCRRCNRSKGERERCALTHAEVK